MALRPVTDAQFARVVDIIQKRRDELSLEACFQTSKSNKDKDFTFVRNFFRRKKSCLTLDQQETLEQLKCEICGTINTEDFERFACILQNRAHDLHVACQPTLEAVLTSRRFKDPDIRFCRNFWNLNASRLSAAQWEKVEELTAAIVHPKSGSDRVALRPAVGRALEKFKNIIDRRQKEFLGVGACSVSGLFARHIKKKDSEIQWCYLFLSRMFPQLTFEEQNLVRTMIDGLLVQGSTVPLKPSYAAKLHDAETILGDGLPRVRLPKSLRQLYGNSMDAEARVMTFFHRVHQVDSYMASLEFQECDYCREGWFGTSRKRSELPGGFESETYKKTNFLRAPQSQWLEASRPICQNCLLEAKRREMSGLPKVPVRFTAANYADPGDTLPETDALTFFEEEILSPIQHIVRIFTLHATGQCELRGHVGNLFQNGPQYVRNIPAAIGDMKMLLVRRCPKDPNRKQRMPFLVSPQTIGAGLASHLSPFEPRRFSCIAAGSIDHWWLR